MDDFSQPKIVYREISTEMEAAIAPEGWFINNKLYMITGAGEAIEYLCGFLNSKIFTKIILCNANFGGGKGVDFLGDVKLPKLAKYNALEKEYNDAYFCKLFGLSDEEIGFIITTQ